MNILDLISSIISSCLELLRMIHIHLFVGPFFFFLIDNCQRLDLFCFFCLCLLLEEYEIVCSDLTFCAIICSCLENWRRSYLGVESILLTPVACR